MVLIRRFGKDPEISHHHRDAGLGHVTRPLSEKVIQYPGTPRVVSMTPIHVMETLKKKVFYPNSHENILVI